MRTYIASPSIHQRVFSCENSRSLLLSSYFVLIATLVNQNHFTSLRSLEPSVTLAEEQLRERLLDRTKDRRISVLPPKALAGSEEADTL